MDKNKKAVIYTLLTILLPGLLAAIITDMANQMYATTIFLGICSAVSLCFAPILYLVYGGDS